DCILFDFSKKRPWKYPDSLLVAFGAK
ncbi:thioesterase, partial [Leptospira interrogans serovar Australis]